MNTSLIQRVTKIIEIVTLIKAEESRAACAAFLMVFILMASYFILRPVRDAMASDWTDTEVSMLWNLQFFISIVFIAAYGIIISRLPFKLVVPAVYGFFALSFVVFYLLIPMQKDPALIEKSFYVWVSTFSLFHLSVFWSLVSNTFTKEQGKRFFAIIAAGASAGAILGPTVPVFFSSSLGLDALILMAAVGITSVIPLVIYLNRFKRKQLNQTQDHNTKTFTLGGNWWQGFKDVVSDRYLLGIAMFILLYVFVGSFIYFEQKNLLAEYSRVERTKILGSIEWIVNSLTFAVAFFGTSRLVTSFGMPTTLVLIPSCLVFGMLALAIAPAVLVVVIIQIIRRVGNYAVTRPAREMLFSEVSQEQRFKAKPVIDVVVYRGGDALSGSIFALFSDGLGFSLATIAVIGAGASSLWARLGYTLGAEYESGKGVSIATRNAAEPTL